MKWAMLAAVALSAAGCASGPGMMRASAQADPAAACAAQIHAYFPRMTGYLDQKLSRQPWFNSTVTGYTLDLAKAYGGDSAVALAFPECPATLRLADGSVARGSFEFLYRDDDSLAKIAWHISDAWNERVTRDYWIAKYGRKEFDRRVAAHKAWIACVQTAEERGVYDPSFLPMFGDASSVMVNNAVDDARAAGADEACGMDSTSRGWDGELP